MKTPRFVNVNSLILALLLSINQSLGQVENEAHKLVLTISPGHLIEFYHGTSANFGAELSLTDRFSFYGEVGKYLPNSLIANNYYQKGTTVLGELKYYFWTSKSDSKHSISLQYMHGNQSYTRADPIGPVNDLTTFSVYEVDKEFQDLSVRYGILFVNSKRLVVNPYLGIGLRYQQVKTGITNEQMANLNFYSDWSPHEWIHRSGKSFYAKAHLGIRIGIKLF